ncbi:hypothetical protein BDV40DRAFT_308641 [Aspergillus tamarii]|uniref:Ribosomal RNA methyltransferase FtsJ domain-containing protein n=1 Tax=Aspergillus tamarii TaxID=41984 RepID=A0A5N6V4J9_ASPTM|nr:hypothetical protein BDV40DRAFT_308641 [Aspergillus tamarii]
MTQDIGDALASATDIYNLDCSHPTILDLCMAPGGFSSTTKKYLRESNIDAVTLHPASGGHQIMARGIFRNILYADITMFAQEMAPGAAICAEHPDLTKFESTRLFLEEKYDIVFCGGAVSKIHPREQYREDCEASRLTSSELVFALNRLKSGGSLVLLLHRVESWDTVCLLHAFDQFSDIQLFKHPKCHAIKSSFYLVAKNIDLEHDTAKLLLQHSKSLWKYLTFKSFDNVVRTSSSLYEPKSEIICQLRDGFGSRLIELAREVWTIQTQALRAADFMADRSASITQT